MPTSSDDVFFDSASGAVTVTVATATAQGLSLTFTGFTGTFAGSTLGVTIAGNVTLGAGATYTYTGLLTINTTSTLTSNGKTWSGALTLSGIVTFTLADAWVIVGTLTLTGNGGTKTVSGNSFTVGGGLLLGTGLAHIITGTTNIILNGTGNLGATGGAITASLRLNLTINTAGTITVISGHNFNYDSGTLTYTAGTVVTTGNLMTINSSVTLNTNGIYWNNITIPTTATVTYGSNLNIIGTFSISVASTITAAGFSTLFKNSLNVLVGSLNINGSNTFALPHDFTVLNLIFSSGGNAPVVNGNNIYVAGNLTISNTANGPSGTTSITLNGTGVWSSSGGTIKNSITIDTSGTITMTGTISYNTGTLTHISGTVVTTGNTLNVALTTTINASGIDFNNITFSNPTITLGSDLNLNGTLTFNNTTVTVNGLFNINTKSLTMTSASAGTASIVLNGTGTWSGSGAVGNNLTINSGGIVTVSGTVTFGASGKTLTYTAGTVVTTGSTLSNGVTCTLNTAGIIWNNFTTSVQGTITNNSLLTIIGTLTYSTNGVGVTFAGTAGWICGTFTCTVAGISHTFTVGNIYTITSAFTITAATNAVRIILKSGTPGTKVKFILQAGATQNVGYVNATDLDSNSGQTIYSFNGVNTTTFNWQTLTYPRQSSYVFQH